MPVPRSISIRKEFLLISYLFLFLIGSLFVIIFGYNQFKWGKQNAILQLQKANGEIAAYTKTFLESQVRSVNTYSQDEDLIRYLKGDENEKNRLLLMYQQILDSTPWVKYVYSGSADGKLLINDYTPPSGFDSTERPWYKNALNSDPDPSAGNLYRDINTKEWLFSVSKVVKDSDSKILGVFSFDSSLKQINSLLNSMNSFTTQNNFVIGGDGSVLAHQNETYVGVSVGQLIDRSPEQLFKDNSGFIEYSFKKQLRFAYYQKIGIAGWTIVSAVDKSEVFGPVIRRIIISVLILFLVTIFLGIMQSLILEIRFIRPLGKLKTRIEEITGRRGVGETSGFRGSDFKFAIIAGEIERMTETSLAKKNSELQLILDSTVNGILVVGKSGGIIHSNRIFRNIWDLDSSKSYNRMTDLDRDYMKKMVKQESRIYLDDFTNPLPKAESSINLHMNDGTILEVSSYALDEEESERAVLWSFIDVTLVVREQDLLREQATTDYLTGLWNRRYFMSRAEYEMEHSRISGTPLSLIQLDVDHFKKINDKYGHAVGDEALKFLAASLKSLVRSTDTVGRTGGEEISLLLPNADGNTALKIGEKIREFFAGHSFPSGGKELSFTVSLGISELNDNLQNPMELLTRADNALYEAKRTGRNRCIIA